MYSFFGFDISVNLLLYILIANFILITAAFFGFTNLRMQIRELKAHLSKLEKSKNELQG